MDSRYTNRFSKLGQKTSNEIKNNDAAGNLTERLTHARGSIEAQKKNTQELFHTSREMITGINTFQEMAGINFIRNIPLPNEDIKNSPSSQLGYVQLTMRFLQSGVIHFIEQYSNAQDRIASLEKTIEHLAAYDSEIEILGSMKTLDIETLEQSELPATPPQEELPSITSPIDMTNDQPRTADLADLLTDADKVKEVDVKKVKKTPRKVQK